VTFIDANRLPADATVDADICIVGAGPAGITVANQLDGSAQRVCLVESGDFAPDEDTQGLYEFDAIGHPVRENFMSRARYFGGTSNLWAGRVMRLMPLDLRRRDWVPHSGWPIGYEVLDRYYPAAARMLKLPSPESVDAVLQRSRAHRDERRLVDNADFEPNVSVWGKAPVRFGSAYRRCLETSRNVSVHVNANVTGVELNRAGNRVEACTGRTLSGRQIAFRARRFVLACGGLETARLLLASRSVQRNGVGNEHDLVGRFYMDHPRAVFGRVMLTRPVKFHGLVGVPVADGMAQIGIQLRETVQEREQLLNSYLTLERQWSDQSARAYQSFVHSAKILLRKGYAGRRLALSRAQLARIPELIYLLAPREIMPHPLYRVARLVKDRFARGISQLIMVNYSEQPPNPNSRVYLTERRDRLGMPRLALDWVIGPHETNTLVRLHELLDGHLRKNGMGRVDHESTHDAGLRYTDASHHLGTTRMAATPREGVVDEHCQVFGVGNLFIAGSGVFPTAGHANPTLTIVALAMRLADHLQAEAA
jgi:choline dehydrogenase-like flavoprotein